MNTQIDGGGRRASDVLYDEVAQSRNGVRRENIRRIKATCDLMEKDGVVITSAEVVRRCGEGGPAYSTVSNTGSRLGEYIRLRMAEQAAKLPNVGASHNRSLADTVADPLLQAQIRDKESTARWFKKENAALRILLKTLRPGVDIDASIARASKGERVPLLGGDATASNRLLGAAFLKLMDHLIGGRQYALVNGRLTINKKIVLGAEEVRACREAAQLSEEEWAKRYPSAGT